MGYDADTQTYTYRDDEGAYYESEPGNRYGELHPQGQRPQRSPEEVEARNMQLKKSNWESVRMMLPFALLVLVFLLLVFKFLSGKSGGEQLQVRCGEDMQTYRIAGGDTCYSVGQAHGLSVGELLAIEGNGPVDCAKLTPGQEICVPI